VAQVNVSPGDVFTRIEGFARTPAGNPANGALVKLVGLALSTQTDANGRFTIANVPTGLGPVDVLIEFSDATGCFNGSAARLPPLPGEITDAGLITLTPSANLPGLVAWWPGTDGGRFAGLKERDAAEWGDVRPARWCRRSVSMGWMIT
jgi:hypothetical protein